MDRIDPERDGLLVIDVQNDFCTGGALAVPHGEAVVPIANALMRRFRHVVLTQDWHPPGHHSFASAHAGRQVFETLHLHGMDQVLWPDHCVQGTSGAAFHPGLDTDRAALILRKGCRHEIDSYSAFRENDRRTPTGLAGWLGERGVRRVFLAGLALDYCVLWSAEDALAAGFSVVVVQDGCRGLEPHGVEAACRRLSERRIPLQPAAELAAAD